MPLCQSFGPCSVGSLLPPCFFVTSELFPACTGSTLNAVQAFVSVQVALTLILVRRHPALPHFAAGEWDWLRGALSTVDRSYGFLDHFFHHIADTHVRCLPSVASPREFEPNLHDDCRLTAFLMVSHKHLPVHVREWHKC